MKYGACQLLFGVINGFNTVTDTFSTVSTTAPSSDFTNDIVGTFWGDSVDVNTQLPAVTNFSSQGTTLANYDLTGNGVTSNGPSQLASSLDSNGRLWGIGSGSAGLFALNLATGAATYCTFESTDVNFQSASITALALAGQNVWVGIYGAQDGYAYLFKIPVQLASSTCDLTMLKTAANEFRLTSQYATQNLTSFGVTQIAVDSSGDAYALQLTSVTKSVRAVKPLSWWTRACCWPRSFLPDSHSTRAGRSSTSVICKPERLTGRAR